MSCTKTTNTCGDTMFTTCIDHEGKLGNNTKITQPCVTQSDVNDDVYKLLDNIIEDTDTTTLGESCINYDIVDGKVKLKSVFEAHEQELCRHKNRIIELEQKDYGELDITSLNLDFKCLVDPCGEPITKLKTLLQIIINETCSNQI